MVFARVVLALVWPRHHAVADQLPHTGRNLGAQVLRDLMDKPAIAKIAMSPVHPMTAANRIHAVEQDSSWNWPFTPSSATPWSMIVPEDLVHCIHGVH